MASYYNEFDPHAAAWIRELMRKGLVPDGEVDERSILDVHPEDLNGFTHHHFFAGIAGWAYALRLANWSDDNPVWTGSPPCQPFSVVGEQKGNKDERHLAPHFISLVRAFRPRMLFGEQVASAKILGAATSQGGCSAATEPEWAWFDDLSDRLEAADYAVGAADIPAAGVGAPHIRQRLFFGDVRMDNTQRERLEGYVPPSTTEGREASGRPGVAGSVPDRPARSPEEHPWANPDALHCGDGKWRVVEPGTFPLAPGLPERVELLRGYGNAIVPQAAAVFIKTFRDCLT